MFYFFFLSSFFLSLSLFRCIKSTDDLIFFKSHPWGTHLITARFIPHFYFFHSHLFSADDAAINLNFMSWIKCKTRTWRGRNFQLHFSKLNIVVVFSIIFLSKRRIERRKRRRRKTFFLARWALEQATATATATDIK